MDISSPVAELRATVPLHEGRRWYFVDEAVHMTARAECPPYTPPMQLPGDESGHDYGPEPQHLRKLQAAARAGRVTLLDAARAPLSSLGDAAIRDAVIEREELRRFALVELGIWLHRSMGADRAAKRRALGYFSLCEVAEVLAEQLGWQHSVQRAFFDEVAAAAESAELPTYDEYTQLRLRSVAVNRFGALAKRDEVDEWLAQSGAPYRPDWAALLQSDRETVESVNALSRLLHESHHTNYRQPESAPTSGTTDPVAAEPVLGVVAGAKPKLSQAAQREARQDARLKHCETEGIVFANVPRANLPYGIAKAAKKLDPPITRQSLAPDVKAALVRRFKKAASGKA